MEFAAGGPEDRSSTRRADVSDGREGVDIATPASTAEEDRRRPLPETSAATIAMLVRLKQTAQTPKQIRALERLAHQKLMERVAAPLPVSSPRKLADMQPILPDMQPILPDPSTLAPPASLPSLGMAEAITKPKLMGVLSSAPADDKAMRIAARAVRQFKAAASGAELAQLRVKAALEVNEHEPVVEPPPRPPSPKADTAPLLADRKPKEYEEIGDGQLSWLDRLRQYFAEPPPMSLTFHLVRVNLLRIKLIEPPKIQSSGYGSASYNPLLSGNLLQPTEKRGEAEGSEGGMLRYEITGDPAALALLKRLMKHGSSQIGSLSPLAEVPSDQWTSESEKLNGVPPGATHFAFAHPLEGFERDFETLLSECGSSQSRADDELFFFFLFGGFCYFTATDDGYRFLAAKAISLQPCKEAPQDLIIDGPFPVQPSAAGSLVDRMRPCQMTPLNDVNLWEMAWVSPGETPGNARLTRDDSVNWDQGAFVYRMHVGKGQGAALFWAVRRSQAQLTKRKLDPMSKQATVVEQLNRAFASMFTIFEEASGAGRELEKDMAENDKSLIQKWLRDFGWLLFLYYGFGIYAYGVLEGFSAFDTCYFLTTTVTTVGYGDFCPKTEMGRLLTSFYAPFGAVVVMGGLVPIVESILQLIDGWTAETVHWTETTLSSLTQRDRPLYDDETETTDSNESKKPPQTKKRHVQEFILQGLGGKSFLVGATFAKVHATLAPLMMAVMGVALCMVLNHFTLVDSVYWVIITFTTIGYGDLLPHTVLEKAVTMVLMLLATSALAATIARFRALVMSQRIHNTNFRLKLIDLMRSEAITTNRDTPMISEDEFILRTIIDFGLIDDKTVGELRSRFREMCHPGMVEIDCTTVYTALVRQGRVLDLNRVDPAIVSSRKKLGSMMATERSKRNPGAMELRRDRVSNLLFPAGVNEKEGDERIDLVKEKDRQELEQLQREVSELAVQLDANTKHYFSPAPAIDMNTDDKGYNEWFNRVWVPSLPTEPTADGFKRPWVDTAVAGLYWEDCGDKMPTRGLEITNLALAQTLLVKTTFTRAEFDMFGVQQERRESGKLQLGDWIKVTSKQPEIRPEKQGGEKHGSGEVVVYFKTVDAQAKAAKAAKEAKAKAAGEAQAARPGSPTRSSSFSRASSPSPTRPEKNKASAKGIPLAAPKSRSPTPGARFSPKVLEEV